MERKRKKMGERVGIMGVIEIERKDGRARENETREREKRSE